MWWGSDPEGEGSSKEPPQSQQLVDLQDQFEQQQTLIAQLKEMLRKTEQSSVVSREKVDEYASTLSEINERAKRSKLRKSEGRKSDLDDSMKSAETSTRKSTVVTPAKEKINLIRQQLEENRQRLAQRDKNQKGFEEMVNQLKAQFDDSQVIMNQSQINIPKMETAPVIITSLDSSKEDLLSVIKAKDAAIEELNVKVQQFQANVLDLQENVKEKDCVIEARTKAITLLSENLSKKGKNTLDMLDETKEQMRVMQQNFVALETKMKEENTNLQVELQQKESQVLSLQERNSELEAKCSDLQVINQKLEETSAKVDTAELEMKIKELESKCSDLQVMQLEESDSKVDNSELEMKIKELSAMNESLTAKISVLETEDQGSRSSSDRTASPQKSKRGRASKKSKPETRIAELEKQVHDLETQTKKQSDTTDGDELVKLNKQLEEMNKTMIKMKAQHKAKLKELQKKTDSGEKVTHLEMENVKLGQRIAELEEEKGNLQLRLVDYESNKDKEYIADLENKIEEQKMEIENHIRTITLLESEITTSSGEISSLRSELANFMHIENAQVCSEMTSVQLEEQLDKEVSQKKEIQNKFNTIVKDNEELVEKMEALSKEKQELAAKLENYMQENMDLIDRLEKLSAEKVSSAESIEIVESLTQQEKLEIEAYQKQLDFPKPNSELEESPELNESVTKLTEETTELMERIELFAVERREVMDKMDNLTSENQQLITKIEKYESEKLNLEERYDNLCNERDILNTKVENLLKENEELLQKVDAFSKEIHEKENMASKEESDALKEQVTEYQTLLENQKQQIIALQGELLKKTENEFITKVNLAQMNEEKGNMHQQLCKLQSEYEALVKENEELKQKLKRSAEIVQEKDSLETVLRETREQLQDLETELIKNVNLVTDLRGTIEDNKSEIAQSAEAIAQLENEKKASKEDTEILRETLQQLNYQIEQKDKMNEDNSETINYLSAQLTELKDCMTENFDQLQHYESEMNKNTSTIDKLTEQLNELNDKILETEHSLEMKDVEINNLKTEHATCEHRIANLSAELKQKNEHFSENCRELREKCKYLENQIQSNSGTLEDIRGPFEAKIVELETKNKEQVDKMKKIAANLKKKVVTCQELEGKLKEVKEKWENERKEKEEKEKVIDEQQKHIQSLGSRLQALESELENIIHLKMETENQLEALTQQLNAKTQNYEAISEENMKLTNDLLQTNAKVTRLNETLRENERLIEDLHNLQSDTEKNQNESVQQLQNQIDSLNVGYETTKNALEAKLQEKDMFIESLEAENTKYKERVFKLEEGLSNIEERRQSLEDKAVELRVQLEAKVTACEEACQSEDFLERRLAALMSHDEIVEQTLKQTTTENQELNDKLKATMSENDLLQSKLHETISKLREIEQNSEKNEMIENENVRLQTIVTGLENEMKRLQCEYERQIEGKNAEIENMETELSAQVQELNAERKHILNRCEHLEDNIKEYTNTELLLNDENDQLKQALARIKSDLDKMAADNQNLNDTVANNLAKIEQLEKELANMELGEDGKRSESVRKDREVREDGKSTESLRKEIDNLQQVIAQKDGDIQNYQRQNMQLQMASFSAPSTASLFESASSVFDIPPAVNPREVQSLKDSLTESDARCLRLENQVREVKEQFDSAQSELQQSRDRFSALEQQNKGLLYDLEQQTQMVARLQEELASQLLRQTAEVGVNDIISTAEDTVSKNSESLQLIAEKTQLELKLKTVTEERDNALDKIQQFTVPTEELVTKEEYQGVSAVPVPREKMTEEESKAELLNKIKTLEFMLFNIEQEKDDTLAQCHEFTNELTRLVYEREKLIKDKVTPERKDVDLSALEGLIVQKEDLESGPEVREQLCSVEYSPVQVKQNIGLQPVAEEILQPKSTYQCFAKDPPDSAGEASGWGTEDTRIKESIESQILHMDATKITAEERQQFQDIEFEHIQIPAPKMEPTAGQKSAYLCYPEECKDILSADTFASEEDGWGWNAEEAKLEAEHRQTLQSQTHAKVEQLEERINDLEVERSRLLEEIKTTQVRSGKLIKKLKDMKQKNDSLTVELNKKASSDFCDLDATIQDELHMQIKTMEKKIAELSEENVREKSERETLLKRIDVLTSANERMVELKEKQDGEMQFWQFKNRELALKLEQLEWGDDSGTPASHGSPDKSESDVDAVEYKKKCSDLDKKVQELNSIVNDLTLDNEEMQCMLEEQRKIRLDAEKALANIPVQQNMKSEQEFLKIENENRDLNEQVLKFNEEKLQLQVQVEKNVELKSQVDELQVNIERLMAENHTSTEQVTVRVEQLQMENQELQKQIQKMNEGYGRELANQIETNRAEIVNFQEQISTLQSDKLHLENAVVQNEGVISELKLKIQQLEMEKSACELKIQEILALQSADKSNDEKMQQINEKLMTTFTELENKNKELVELNTLLNTERVQSRQTLSDAIEQLSKEWSERLDQRGNDVAESWKLHLDARETEFAQKEQDLKSQVHKLSGKNEDLEKQLDLVVHSQNTASNSVIESLQQTLNEKQSEIVELSTKLQEALNELQSKRKEMEQSHEMKDIEMDKLKTQTIEMENLLNTTNNDLASLRREMVEQDRRLTKEENDRQNLQQQLDAKVAEYQQLEAKVHELNGIIAEENAQIVELRQLIETQVLKIEELKGELYEKSNDYDALVAEFDSLHPVEEVARPLKEKHVHFEAPEEPKAATESENLAEPVIRAELDLALYMWHQRDVRCEELTLELMHLLEERDTLQLRLSNALRLNEDLRKPGAQPSNERPTEKDSPKIHKSTGAIPKSKSTAIVLGATGTELATEATEQTPTEATENLANKLSQLRSIGYRDKTLQDDQESRYMQQMSVMQQHRDLAAKLPAEAAARLVDASYTLSRDVQSPSKVLLNWLWGRSTPKVNDV